MRYLYIAGVNRRKDLEMGSLSITQALTYQIDTCSFVLKGDKPNEGEEVIVEDDTLGRVFGGIIVNVQLQRDKGIKTWSVECDDYTSKLDSKLVVETYENVSADFIFRDIVAKYCPDFTANGVRTGSPTVEKIIFDYKYPSECFRELCNYVGWHWQPDYYKDLQFFSAEDLATPSPMELRPGSMFSNIKHSIDTQGLRNRVYVRGGTMLSDPFTYEIESDGVARIWTLPHKPHEMTFNLGSVGVENLHDEENYDYLMNYQEKYVRASAQTPTPAKGVTLSFIYKYDIDVITMVEDIESQEKIAVVQNSDGVYEHVIVDDSLVTIDAAEAAGMADLREHANPKVKGSFETEFVLPQYTWGNLKEMTWGDLLEHTWGDLKKVKRWEPGQLVTMDLPDRGIQGTYLIQRVVIIPITTDKWRFRVEYGGRLLGIADFLKALVSAQQKKRFNDTALLNKFSYGQETTKIIDELVSTPRGKVFICGEPDAICGFVECNG